jgi:hypothetical protein
MKKKILFIGNCQISIYLFLSNYLFFNEFFTFEKYLIFQISENDLLKIYQNIDTFDFIITQMISDNFRNENNNSNNLFSTKYLKSQINPNKTKLIMFPSCYFNFSFPFTISKENVYIDLLIEEIYNKNNLTSESDFYKIINDQNYFSKNEMIERFNQSIKSLEEREMKAFIDYKPDHFIFLSEFIVANSRQCLFYTFNHPTNVILKFLSQEILKILATYINEKPIYYKKINENDNNIDPLNKYKVPILLCFQSFFDFDLKTYNNNLVFRGNMCDIKLFFKLYCDYEIKKKKKNKIYKKNKTHFLINKNIYSYMEKQIIRCNVPKKSVNNKSNFFVKCTTNSSIYSSQKKTIAEKESKDNDNSNEKNIKNCLLKKKKLPGKFIPQAPTTKTF